MQSENKQMANKNQGKLKYGALVMLGYNGQLPRGNRGRKRSKFILYQRPEPNGVKPLRNTLVKTTELSNRPNDTHCITYNMPEKMAAVTEYGKDDNTDMFQIGRSGSPAIDFVLFDTSDTADLTCTISRFACRIVVDRKDPSIAKIYAAGFNDSNKVSLGESALKWERDDGSMDGLTTNGVLIVHPSGEFRDGESEYGCWREVSVGGDLYSFREDKRVKERGRLIEGENNILKDGTLIYLSGATLLWRSAKGLSKSPEKEDIEDNVLTLNEDSKCLLNLNGPFKIQSVAIPRKKSSTSSNEPRPYVHADCGHVQCYRGYDVDRVLHATCQACDKKSLPIPLCMGLEPAFYVDYGPPMYAFDPCGHMATEKTIKFWAKVEIPEGLSSFISQCPFCAVPLNGWPGYVKLKFSFLLDGTL